MRRRSNCSCSPLSNPLRGAVPVGGLDEGGLGLAELELETAFRALRDFEGELVGAVIERHQLIAHVAIELGARVLRLEEIVDALRVLDAACGVLDSSFSAISFLI